VPTFIPHLIPSYFEMPGKPKGSKNYQKEILLEIIEDVLPAGAEDWKLVLERYKDRTKDNAPRDPDDVKRYFFEKLANKCRAPTGQSCPPALVSKAQQIYRKILDSNRSGCYPTTSDAEDEDNEDEDDDEQCKPAVEVAESVAVKTKNSRNRPTQRGEAAKAIGSMAASMKLLAESEKKKLDRRQEQVLGMLALGFMLSGGQEEYIDRLPKRLKRMWQEEEADEEDMK